MLGIGRFFGQRKEDVPGFELMFGPRGLSGQVMIWNRTDMVPAERATVQSSVIATTSNRSALEKGEIEAIRRLNFNFRGKWPSFRIQLPGFYPRPLGSSDARTLLLALDIALDVAKNAKDDPSIIKVLRGDGTDLFMKGRSKAMSSATGTCKIPPLSMRISMLHEVSLTGSAKSWIKGQGVLVHGIWLPHYVKHSIEDHPGRPKVPRRWYHGFIIGW